MDYEKLKERYERGELSAIERELYERAAAGGVLPKPFKPLWPKEYQSLDAETCYRFIIENVRTFEQTSGQDLPIPDKEYLKRLCDEWFDCFLNGKPMHIVKSRRLIVSWFCSAVELFVAGLRRGRFCIAARAYEGLNGSQQFVYRVWYLYDQLCRNRPDWKLKTLDPTSFTGNPSKEYLAKMVLPNGSSFEAVNADKDSFQGGGVTIARIEELSQFNNVPQLWGQGLFVTQGVPGSVSGFAYSISNASANPDYLELLGEEGGTSSFSDDRVLHHGLLTTWNGHGGKIVGIHYAADPAKDAEWADQAKKGYPHREWMREMEGYVNVFDGEPVYPMYDGGIHESRFDFPKATDGGYVVAGWDCGNTLNPAFVLGYVFFSDEGPQLQVLLEVTAVGMAMEEFCQKVTSELDKHWKGWRSWEHRIIHVADPAGNARQGNNGGTAYGVAKKHGFFLRASKNQLQPRISSVTRFLMGWVVEESVPKIVFNKPLCRTVCDGLAGAYCYRDNKLAGSARSVREPKKDGYSHVQDALQYLCLEAEKLMEGRSHEPVDRIGARRRMPSFATRYV